MSLGSSSPPSQQTVTSSTEPYKAQKPYLNRLFQRADKLYKGSQPRLYGGPFTADQSADSNEAAAQLEGFARGGATDFTDQLFGAHSFGLGPVLSPETNPYLQQYGDALGRQIGDTFNTQILPGLRAEAVGSGNTSSTRREIAAGIAGRGAADAIERAQSGLYNEAYQAGLDTYTDALALAPQTLQTGAYPAMLLDTVGQRDTALRQQDINEAIQRHNFTQLSPISRLAQYQNFITGNFGSQTAQNMLGSPGPSGAQRLVGGALGGLQFAPMLSGAFPGLGAAAGPVGMGAGALLAMLT